MAIRLLLNFVAISIAALAFPGCQGDLEPLRASLQDGLTHPGMPGGNFSSRPEHSPPSPPMSAHAVAAAPSPIAVGALAPACSDTVVQQIITPITLDSSPVRLMCSARLPANAVVTRQVVFEGSAANGASLDCNGGRLVGRGREGDKEPVVVRSIRTGSSWDRPNGIVVRNCKIAGSVRIYGMGRNGEAEAVRLSSLNANHTERAQSAAPTNVTFDRVEITGAGGVRFYVSPGVTKATLTDSIIEGTSTSAVIYLDAESGGTRIANNTFRVRTKNREVIAIDGSAYNNIEGNRFEFADNGGVFAYRNCGEGGTIRHQSPQFNKIENNTFSMNGSDDPAVWLNSRNGNRSYCFLDPDHPFGSSLTSLDLAQNNVVSGNTVRGDRGDAFRNSDPTNIVVDNSQ